MPESRILTSQMCLLKLFAKIKFSRNFSSLQYVLGKFIRIKSVNQTKEPTSI